MLMIETFCSFRNRMNHNGTDTGNLCSLNGTKNRIGQEARSNSPALKLFIRGKPAEHHDGNGIGHVTLHTSRRSNMRNGTDDESIIPNNSLLRTDHVRARRRSDVFICESSPSKPSSRTGSPESKSETSCCAVNFFRWGNVRNRIAHSSHGALVNKGVAV